MQWKIKLIFLVFYKVLGSLGKQQIDHFYPIFNWDHPKSIHPSANQINLNFTVCRETYRKNIEHNFMAIIVSLNFHHFLEKVISEMAQSFCIIQCTKIFFVYSLKFKFLKICLFNQIFIFQLHILS